MTGDRSSKSNTRQAQEQLRDLIFSGDLAAGSNHLESELAERLGMSRTPVREAALVLAGQGLVEMRQRKGIRILPISPDDMRDIYDVLTELESLAAADAARRGPTAAELSELEAAIDAMDAALSNDDRLEWAAADDRFHRELVSLGGNTRALLITAMLSDQVRRARRVTLHIRPAPLRSNDDHRAVLDAIRTGDPDQARQLHRAHRLAARNLLVGLLEKSQLKSL